jgi:hypothetical protein
MPGRRGCGNRFAGSGFGMALLLAWIRVEKIAARGSFRSRIQIKLNFYNNTLSIL